MARLIPNVESWIKRKYGIWNFELTQFLTGHGPFKNYTVRIGKSDTNLCNYCGEVDSAEHTVLHCERWIEMRRECRSWRLNLCPENIIDHMCTNEAIWNDCSEVIRRIIRGKAEDEWVDERRAADE